MVDKLETYREKRNFSRTSEPAGRLGDNSTSHQYVMHMHDASHHHFDLRLEQEGVLRSWALPRGPSLEPGEKRLAVEVEDHPLEYGDFEGVIPPQEYGGGTVLLWDRGFWSPVGKPRADRLDFELQGEKLSGRWTLVRMRGDRKTGRKHPKNWLLIKRSAPVSPPPDDLSVATGRSMEEIAAGDARHNSGRLPDLSSLPGARRQAMPDSAPVQLATLADEPPDGEQWIHELKFDGYRLQTVIDQGSTRFLTRNGKDWTRRFPKLRQAMSALPTTSAILDGELVVMEADGSTSFRKLQESLSKQGKGSGTDSLVYQVFDLLYINGFDLRRTPLLERKGILARLLADPGLPASRVRYSDHLMGRGPAFFEQACEMGLEGIISKKADAVYRQGQQRTWLKVKCTRQDEFVVGGYTRPSGARSGFGSLLLGAYQDGRLLYAGRVGSGFSAATLAKVYQQLAARTRSTSPFAESVPDANGVQWVTPNLVVDVEFTEKTASGVLRHPVFRGVREDKTASEVQAAVPGHAPAPTPLIATANSSGAVVAGVTISHPDRILYPDEGLTKLDLARYYEATHHAMLPPIEGRPLSLLRCPEGLEGECFFQKHPATSFAREVPRTRLTEKSRKSAHYLYVKSPSDLVRLVQFGVLEFHPWGSRIEDVEHPDTLIFDLDPGPDLPWRAIARAATTLRERLASLGMPSFLQASGGKGLHLVIPIQPRWDWDVVKAFCQGIARAHATDDPNAFTTNMAKSRRHGKVFIDYHRNGRGNTSIARYSTRARPGAPVATPLRWDELSPGVTANRYSVGNLRRRLAALKTDPWADYEEARVPISKALVETFAGG